MWNTCELSVLKRGPVRVPVGGGGYSEAQCVWICDGSHHQSNCLLSFSLSCHSMSSTSERITCSVTSPRWVSAVPDCLFRSKQMVQQSILDWLTCYWWAAAPIGFKSGNPLLCYCCKRLDSLQDSGLTRPRYCCRIMMMVLLHVPTQICQFLVGPRDCGGSTLLTVKNDMNPRHEAHNKTEFKTFSPGNMIPIFLMNLL